MSKSNKKQIKVRSLAPDFSTHTRKMPTLKERQNKAEKKYRNPIIKY